MIPAYANQLREASTGTQAFAEWRGIRFFGSPWVQGQVASAYFGPIGHELCFAEGTIDWSEGIQSVIETMAETALNMGANAIVACEMTLEPYPTRRRKMVSEFNAAGLLTMVAGPEDAEPTLRLAMVGTGAELRRL